MEPVRYKDHTIQPEEVVCILEKTGMVDSVDPRKGLTSKLTILLRCGDPMCSIHHNNDNAEQSFRDHRRLVIEVGTEFNSSEYATFRRELMAAMNQVPHPMRSTF